MATAQANPWSEPRDGGIRDRFWRKLKRLGAALPSRVPFSEELLAAYYCAFDRNTPRHVQASLVAAIAYFVLPLDSLPDIVPMLGFSDDAAVLAAAIKRVSAHITDDHRKMARAFLERVAEPGGESAIHAFWIRLSMALDSRFTPSGVSRNDSSGVVNMGVRAAAGTAIAGHGRRITLPITLRAAMSFSAAAPSANG